MVWPRLAVPAAQARRPGSDGLEAAAQRIVGRPPRNDSAAWLRGVARRTHRPAASRLEPGAGTPANHLLTSFH